MTNDYTYCSNSSNCIYTECPRHLNGFNGVFVSLSNEFDCEVELEKRNNDKTDNV